MMECTRRKALGLGIPLCSLAGSLGGERKGEQGGGNDPHLAGG